ncbi:MAG: 30S ribosomal protein S9 [Candidatus Moraniibacteriota bacterium]|jgi:small subunit ribosomal protein S9
MVTKDKVKKSDNKFFTGTYHYGVGRRKTATAQIRIYCDGKDAVTEDGLIVNGKKYTEYFHTDTQKDAFLQALKVAGMDEKCAVSVLVKGGGISGQADAVKLGIARALVKYDETLRPSLKADGLLTRDARKVERKKPGLRKARRSPQWSKR